MIYKRGMLPLDNPNGISVAVVGTRKAGAAGENLAYEIAFNLAKKGVRIISGMAAGIDTCAHVGALDAGGETAAVFGCSVAMAYPASNRELMQRIVKNGCVCSEYGFEENVYPSNFSDRNRIVCALSDAVVIIEAAEKSGSLITAKLAAKQGKKLFVTKNTVFKNGKNLFEGMDIEVIESAGDILEYFGISSHETTVPKTISKREEISGGEMCIDKRRLKILNILEKMPLDEEEIAVAADENPVETGVLLTLMEIENLIIRLPDGKYTING